VLTRPSVAICPGSGHPLKSWPIESWQEVVSGLIADGIMVYQIGGPRDPLVAGAVDYRGASLARTASILEATNALLTHENAMAHLAAAVGSKAAVIYGPTSKAMFGYPWHLALGGTECPPCFWLDPTWRDSVCAIGLSSCANFPPVDDVAKGIREMV
jgi:ADP-heptose:LPS heptosyltransferase